MHFRKCLEESARAEGVDIHSYVFMTNHLHLLLTPKDPLSISKLMHSAVRRYVGYFNARYKRTGTLWEGRFHTTTIGSDFYLLACHRYIDNNPVRAGLVPRPELYPWSSHRFYALNHPDSLVIPHETVIALGRDDAARRRAYRGLFEEPENPEQLEALREAARRSLPLMSELPPARRKMGRPRKKVVPDTSF
jgi:REP-associated tyrosine transposase